MSQALNPLTFPLHGSRLIEASAGTGKTWTIAALYLRLVLGHGGEHGFAQPLLPKDILVMTFTRAATRELSDRIRARLTEAVAGFRGAPCDDPFLSALIEAYPDAAQRSAAAYTLANAAECMDEAAIYTIDAWCQRMLREHAFDSGSVFDETLEPNPNQQLKHAIQDYWRSQIYPLAPPSLAALMSVWATPDAALSTLSPLINLPVPSAQPLPPLSTLIADYEADMAARLAQLADGWVAQADAYEAWISEQRDHHKALWASRKFDKKNISKWFDVIRDWARAPDNNLHSALSKIAQERFTPSGLKAIYVGPGAAPIPPQAQAFADLLDAVRALPQLAERLLAHGHAWVQQRLSMLKAQAGTFGFQDLPLRLDAALAVEGHGATLQQRIVQQYPVALIDEFQDTSPLQYRLFERLYQPAANHHTQALLLIGDPKQSIYRFRGADIYSYLAARRATRGRHYVLDTNYRSTVPLVETVNALFGHAEQHPNGAFNFPATTGADTALPFAPVDANGRSDQLCDAGVPQPALSVVWHQGSDEAPTLNKATLQAHLAQCCAEQIVTWLNSPTLGFVDAKHNVTPLHARDIAVLVRNRYEALSVSRALLQRGVASVYLSDLDSVFASAEAQDLQLWLSAIATPQDGDALRAALATPTLARSFDELAELAQDDLQFDAYSDLIESLHGVWQRHGVLAMLRRSLHVFALPARWLADPQAGERRLTNVLHLAELLQSASVTLDGEAALIRWLITQCNDADKGADNGAREDILRLESDADLIKIATIHKSKGLEYPLVMLPFAHSFREVKVHKLTYLELPSDDGAQRVTLDPNAEDIQRADQERLREDLRLLYVAATRPRYTLWIGLGALRQGNSATCVNHLSASGYLFGGSESRSAQDWRAQLAQWVSSAPSAVLSDAESQVSITPLRPRTPPPALRSASEYSGDFDRSWSVTSYSALARRDHADDSAHSASAAATTALAGLPLELQHKRDDEQANALPWQTPVPRAAVNPDATAVWHRFARGPHIGTFLHDQLEWLSDHGFALTKQADDNLAKQLIARCRYTPSQDHADAVLTWLHAVVQQPLSGVGASLVDIAAHGQLLPEMAFWLPAPQSFSTASLDALCQQHLLNGAARPALTPRSSHGMLMGFADLVFAYQGRYWVLDYKTNALGANAEAYTAPALVQAMATHRYDVQAAIYLLALHRLLRARLGAGYDPATQLGGAVYYFMRGLDGPSHGVHIEPATPALLEALDALLCTDAAEVSA